MTNSSPAQTTSTSLTRDLLDAARYYLGGRRSLYILAGIAAVAGVAFDWSWLVTAGIAPVLLAALPCAAMCALGLCMHRIGGRSCAQDPASHDSTRATSSDEAESVTPSIDQRPEALVIVGDTPSTVTPSADPQPSTAEERRTVDA